MIDYPLLLLGFVFLAFFMGGVLKGILGLGLPLVSLSILGVFLEPTLVLALLVMPIVASNFWQTFSTGLPWKDLRRFYPLIALFITFTWLGASLIASVDPSALLVILGLIVVIFSFLNLLGPNFYLPPHCEVWAGPTTGVIAGLMNGISTVNGPPLVMYLVGLQLPKETFIRAYGLIALCGSVPLALSYVSVGVLGAREALWSCAALLPVFLGLWLGQRIRGHINPTLFRRVLLWALILLGLNLIRRGLLS